MEPIKLYSGECYLCEVGIFTGEKDMNGEDLHTGDIVQLWSGRYVGMDIECWYPSDGLTAIVKCNYSYPKEGKFFTMGIYEAGIKGPCPSGVVWDVRIVKSHTEIIRGEKFKAFGFNYR